MALAIGYLLQIIPFRSLLVLAGKLCLMLARPVLFLFCAFELAKYMGKATKFRPRATSSESSAALQQLEQEGRWLYALCLCWTGTDRPGMLFDRAVAWLIPASHYL
jgi:hypothetical protein